MTRGGKADLRPEQSENTTAGLVVEIPAVKGLSLSFDWFDNTYRDRVAILLFGQMALLYPERITRGATTQRRELLPGSEGLDLRGPLRAGASKDAMLDLVRAAWTGRTDHGAEERLLVDRNARIRTVAQGPDGALYVLTDGAGGTILRLKE